LRLPSAAFQASSEVVAASSDGRFRSLIVNSVPPSFSTSSQATTWLVLGVVRLAGEVAPVAMHETSRRLDLDDHEVLLVRRRRRTFSRGD
jgi:hypothetical protein